MPAFFMDAYCTVHVYYSSHIVTHVHTMAEVIHVLPDLHLNITANKRIPLERVKLPPGVNTSGIYISVLTMPRNHPTRFAAHLFTWMQTVNPSQVHVHVCV